MNKRLFLGIPLSTEFVEMCNSFIESNKLNVRWIPQQNWHITVLFIGDFPAGHIGNLSKELSGTFHHTQKLHLNFKGFLYQPNINKPRMIWGEFEHSTAFDTLVKKIYETIKSFCVENKINIKLSYRKKTSPHITLARLSHRFEPQELLTNNNCEFLEYKPDFCNLYKSTLLPKGAQYKVLNGFSFGGQKF
jgi:2'-5' RNA ligase